MIGSRREFDVAIVGLGPVGALLANLLGQAGLSVVVLERDAAIHALPRAVHFDGEVMRIFQNAGLADAVAGVARASAKGMRFVGARGETLMVRRSTDGPGMHGWATNWYFHQPDLDAVLRAGLERFECVDVRLEHDVTAVTRRADGVLVEAADSANRTKVSIEARFAVGCDGSRSLMREAIGASLEDLGLHQPWLVVDVLVDPRSPRARRLPDYTVQHCDPAQPMTRVHVGGVRHRWEIMLLPGDETAVMDEAERFWRMVRPFIGPEDGVIERAAVYTFHSLIADRWRRGPLFLAGDSCHQTPPFLGQGMCAGMRDAANLAWKLVAVLSGTAPAALLETYGPERAAHVREFIELAVRLGGVIQATDPEVVARRNERFRDGPEMFDFPQPQLGAGAWAGPRRPCGTVFPQPRLPDGARLDDSVGARFAVLRRSGAPVPPGPNVALDVASIERPGPAVEAWLEEHDAYAVVLRPDRYVFGLARDERELDRLLGQLPLGAATVR